MTRPEAPRIHFDNRVLWDAIRSAGGNVPMAARSLGVSTRELLLQLASSDHITWRAPVTATSGVRRRQDDEPRSKRAADDEPAWGDED